MPKEKKDADEGKEKDKENSKKDKAEDKGENEGKDVLVSKGKRKMLDFLKKKSKE